MTKNRRKILFYSLLLGTASFLFFVDAQVSLAACTIQSATFSPPGNVGIGRDVQLKVVGSDCGNNAVEVSIIAKDLGPDHDIGAVNNKEVRFSSGNPFVMNLKSGEDGCAWNLSPDCQYYVEISFNGNVIYSTETGGASGTLEYDCQGGCDQNWEFISIENTQKSEPAPKCTSGEVLKEGKCVPVDPKYYLLAPLPCRDDAEGCVKGELRSFDPTFKDGENSKLGIYLNLLVIILIGVVAVAAVVRLTISGIEYYSTDSGSGKEAARTGGTEAVLSLILACGCWIILFEINPDLLKTDLSTLEYQKVTVSLEDQISGRLGQSSGRCVPITDPNSPCAPAKLSAFSSAEQASSICNGESGGNPGLNSGVDKCSDGKSFSFGLFQINAIAHANNVPGGVCKGVFRTNGAGTQGTCLERSKGVCIKYDCQVVDQAKFQSCVQYLSNPANNIGYASGLNKSSGWRPWGFYASCQGKF